MVKTKDIKRIPDLRFSEFKDEWKIKKLGKIAELTSSKRVYLSDYVDSGIPFYRGKEISELKRNEVPVDILYITNQAYEGFKKKYGVPKKDDILITAVGTLGNVLRIRNNDKFYFKDGNLIWIRNISESPRFLETILEYKKREIEVISIGSSQRALTIVELNKLLFPFPTIPEQEKIASFLSAVDKKIQQLTAKKELLEQYKKGVMQRIFSQEIRFTDDNGKDYPDWQEKRLGDVTKIYDGTHTTPDYTETGIPFYSVEHVTGGNFTKTKFIAESVFEKENKRVKLEKADILMTRIGDIGTSVLLDWDIKASFYVSLALIKQSKLFNSSYLNQFIKSDHFQRDIFGKTIHAAFPKKINLGEIGKCLVLLPCDEEQDKIASLLSGIDKKIESVQIQLTQTQTFKKGLLQQLFV